VPVDGPAGQPAPLLSAPTHRVTPAPRPVDEAPVERPARRRAPRGGRGLPGRLPGRARAALVTVVTSAAVGLAVVTGVAWAGAEDVPRASRVDRPGTAVGWSATLAGLDAARSRAFAAGDAGPLRAVYATGAPALARDRSALAALTGAGLRAQGLRLTATSVVVRRRAGGRVRLAVTDVMPPYRLVDAAGVVADRRPGRGAASWTVVLSRDHGRWRVYDVVRG
jgi:hypothetical protein